MPRDFASAPSIGRKSPGDSAETPEIVASPEQQSHLPGPALQQSISPPEAEKQSSRQSLSSLTRTESPPSSRFVTVTHGANKSQENREGDEGDREGGDEADEMDWEDEDADAEHDVEDVNYDNNDAHFDNIAAFLQRQSSNAANNGSNKGVSGGAADQGRGRGLRRGRSLWGSGSSLGQLLMGRDPDQDDSGGGRLGHAAALERTARDELHPYVQTLSIKDEGACVALEEACWKDGEREGREAVCPSFTLVVLSCLVLIMHASLYRLRSFYYEFQSKLRTAALVGA